MKKNYLEFIKNEDLIECIEHLHKVYIKANKSFTKAKLYKNKIDIFKLIFDKKFSKISEEDLIQREINRQMEKSITNAIGDFHENILTRVEGFEKIPAGMDIKSEDNKIFIELKNKHNTLKGENYKQMFDKLYGEVEKHPGSKAYLARILDTSSTSKVWSFSHKTVEYNNESVLIISGDNLYKLVTGRENALLELYKALPQAIDDYLETLKDNEQDENAEEANKAYNEILKESDEFSIGLIDAIAYANYKYYLGFSSIVE